MMQSDIERLFKMNLRNYRVLVVPLLAGLWLFYSVTVFFYRPSIAFVLFLVPISARAMQLTMFYSDRAILPIVGYHDLQGFLHSRFEKDNLWLKVSLKVYPWCHPNPYYRCRARTLSIYHKKQTGVETKCIEN